MMKHLISLLFLVNSLLFAGTVQASDDAHHSDHWNHLSVLGGMTLIDEEIDPIFGVEYERLSETLGGKVGVVSTFEVGLRHHTAYSVGFGIALHPYEGFKLLMLPLFEFEDGHKVPLVRTGAGYDFHLGQISVGPFVAFDLGGHDVIGVYTIAIGYSF